MEGRWNRGFDRVLGVYRRILQFNERHRWSAILVLLLVVVMLVQSMGLAGKLGFGFFPDIDKGELYVKLEYPTRHNLAETRLRVAEVMERLADVPEVAHSLVTIGKVEGVVGQSSEGVHLAQVLLTFSERDQRSETIDDIMVMIRDRLADYPGAIVTVSVPAIVGGQSVPIEMEISGSDLDELDTLALRAKRLSVDIPGCRDVDTTVRTGKPEMRVYPRRSVLADLDLPATSLGMALRGNVEGITAGTFKQDARNYDIVVKLEEEPGKQQVRDFQLPGGPGRPVALTALADVENTVAPIQITREDKQRTSKLLSQLDSAVPLGVAVGGLAQAMEVEGMPPGYEFRFGGMAESMAEGQGAMGEAGLVALVLVILTLAAILESFRQPWLILVTLPLGLIGMMWGLAVGGCSIDMFALMGAVMMIGIVVNNAILIMDQFNVHVAEGVPRHRAMISAACERFRPIVMITIAAVLGMLPLALGQGVGAELRNSVGFASVGGILVSGILTLIVMPILYDLSTRRANGKQKKG
jgi:HAE1 family hydrophobic/amphiphilic exporter-1